MTSFIFYFQNLFYNPKFVKFGSLAELRFWVGYLTTWSPMCLDSEISSNLLKNTYIFSNKIHASTININLREITIISLLFQFRCLLILTISKYDLIVCTEIWVWLITRLRMNKTTDMSHAIIYHIKILFLLFLITDIHMRNSGLSVPSNPFFHIKFMR